MNSEELHKLIEKEYMRSGDPERLMQLRNEAMRVSDAYFACLYVQLKKYGEFKKQYQSEKEVDGNSEGN